MARVAALQFASGTDLEANLATCLRMIDSAQVHAPDLLVLPEFSNHISWYDDAEHAWRVSVARDGPFLRAIAERARRHGCYIVINVSLRGENGELTVSSMMYDPAGQLLAVADKQTLMGHENTWFARSRSTSEVVSTPFGRLAMFPCRDGVTCETPRGLALRGAQLFCDSLNSFALDEATLHVPARAPENKVFLVAANKVGPLIPEQLLQAVSDETHIPLRFLQGAGESQIVSPTGEILARGPRQGEAVVFAEIDLALADNKARADGTGLFASRRPQLYLPIVEPPQAPVCAEAAATAGVACLSPAAQDESALAELPGLVAALPADTVLAVLPELFCYGSGSPADMPEAAELAARAIDALAAACAGRDKLLLCTSLVLPHGAGFSLTAVLVGAAGVLARQPQLHSCMRHSWSVPGDELTLVDLPWGRLALFPGDDAVHPELVKVAALRGAHAIAVPFAMQEAWEEVYGLRSRAAENRICVVASTRPLAGRAGLIATLERDFTLMTPWLEREFDGYINAPLVTEQLPGATVTVADIHPQAACNKLMSERTDLLLDRPWRLSRDLVHPSPGTLASH
ncbi:MAG: carbon-nitrogen hydrolase family protein [Halioglobus sp.]|nr:carbon-nitrogen hydrolase family protein [Halioglobus sp.]